MWTTSMDSVAEWAYGGVDHELQGNGGPECAAFLTFKHRFFETGLACLFGLLYLYWGYKRIHVPPVPKVIREDRGGKRALLVLMCLVFGMEIGYKFSSKTVIYILNPCHIITLIQIFLLAAPPTSRLVTVLFRIHLHCLHGALLAIFLPVLNTRLLPMETEVYFLQHGLMLIIPFYLLRTGMGGVYTVEPLSDFSWAFQTCGLLFFYHFLLLQGLGLVTQVNLNNMLCPAVSDPFYGPNYRLWAIGHQTLLILSIGKLYTAVSLFVLEAMGTVVWTGEKYVAMATQRVQQLCNLCRVQGQNGQYSGWKRNIGDEHQD